jgi:hypothetical protein
MDSCDCDFDLSSFSFEIKTENEEVLDFIKSKNFFDNEIAKNLHYFFTQLPIIVFANENRRACAKDDPCFEVIENHVCWSDAEIWSCHIAAPYFSVMNPDWDCILGFAQQAMRKSNAINVFLHSFNCLGLDFIDPTVQARCNQEIFWTEKKKIPAPRLRAEDINFYFGVKMPKNIIDDILRGDRNNLWGYLKDKVFYSFKKTEEFVEIVKNQGIGWKHDSKDLG